MGSGFEQRRDTTFVLYREFSICVRFQSEISYKLRLRLASSPPLGSSPRSCVYLTLVLVVLAGLFGGRIVVLLLSIS